MHLESSNMGWTDKTHLYNIIMDRHIFHQNSKNIHSLQTQGKTTDMADNTTSFLLRLEQQDTKEKLKSNWLIDMHILSENPMALKKNSKNSQSCLPLTKRDYTCLNTKLPSKTTQEFLKYQGMKLKRKQKTQPKPKLEKEFFSGKWELVKTNNSSRVCRICDETNFKGWP